MSHETSTFSTPGVQNVIPNGALEHDGHRDHAKTAERMERSQKIDYHLKFSARQ